VCIDKILAMETDRDLGPTANRSTSEDQDITPYPGTPQWVKVFGAIVAAVAVAFVLLRFTIGMQHG